ncbi:uncharacterized protein B0I36DRAFT_432783 [Microdochium trichocladiopsis]|uniref:Rhodopsin domain-containing protein n=1 Tax=Microdochium trichocladiopsis TaxID=1682393 RepID=A0A9P8Y416_9PEZI|nr:uncharacterized protein B0I36DRAFT_432783 [Microdochium trichocladiopsis]KAH7027537.1 hypothetical protein B0I36DRAFT_432783 [Microdochium trichocladiopsis]
MASPDASNGQIYEDYVPLSPKSLGPFITGLVLVGWTTAWMAARLYCRIKILKIRLMFEDWLQLFALLCFYGDVAAYAIRAIVGAANYPNEVLQWYHLERRDQATIALMIMYTMAVAAVKLSIIWTMSRIFSQNRVFRYIAYATMVFSGVLMLALLLLNVLWCAPDIKILWSCDLTAIQTHCAGPEAALRAEIAMSTLNLLNEIVIFLLPVPMVWRLRIGWRYKAGVFCIFAIGILTLICAFLRLVFRVWDDWPTNDNNISSFYASLLLLEPGLGLIAVSSMGMKPIFEVVLSPLLGTSSSKAASSGNKPNSALECPPRKQSAASIVSDVSFGTQSGDAIIEDRRPSASYTLSPSASRQVSTSEMSTGSASSNSNNSRSRRSAHLAKHSTASADFDAFLHGHRGSGGTEVAAMRLSSWASSASSSSSSLELPLSSSSEEALPIANIGASPPSSAMPEPHQRTPDTAQSAGEDGCRDVSPTEEHAEAETQIEILSSTSPSLVRS